MQRLISDIKVVRRLLEALKYTKVDKTIMPNFSLYNLLGEVKIPLRNFVKLLKNYT